MEEGSDVTIKRVGIGVGVVVIVLVAGVLALRQSSFARVGLDMHSQAQQGRVWFGLRDVGFGLSGELVTTPVSDWSFASRASGVKVQVTPWWRIPYTINTAITASPDGRRIYLVSDYFAPAPGREDLRGRFPEARGWNRYILRDPRIRVQIGDKIFNFLAYPLTDPEEIESARAAFLAHVPPVREQVEGPEAVRPRVYVIGLVPRWDVAAVRDAHARAANGLTYLAEHRRD
jgi:hypothetical protein